MLTTESYPVKVFQLWKISQENPYVLGDLTWTSMDYLGESGIGSWAYATPAQAESAAKASVMLGNPNLFNGFFEALAKGEDPMKAMAQGGNNSDMAALAFLFGGYPWHAAFCGGMDLTG